MVTIDGEWGVGMRLDSVTKYPTSLHLALWITSDWFMKWD